MHRHIGKPGKEHDMPEGEFDLAGKGLASFPDGRVGEVPEILKPVDGGAGDGYEIAQADEAEGEEDEDHPGGGIVGETRDKGISGGGDEGNDRAHAEHGEDPADTVGKEVIEAGHREPEPDPDGGGRDRHHRSGEKAEHDPVDEIVDDDEPAPADLFQLIIEGQAGPGGDRGGHEGPAEDGEEVPDDEPEDKVDCADSGGDKEGADHQLRSGGMLTGILAEEIAEAKPGLGRNGLAFKF